MKLNSNSFIALEIEFKLNTQLMVGQSFDGAATMAGIKTGVAKRFTDLIPHVVFVHCYAHKLNLALQDATNQLKDVSDILLILQNVSVFVTTRTTSVQLDGLQDI